MNNISIASGVLACTVTYDGLNTISIALKQGDSPVAQWNFFGNEPPKSSEAFERRRRAILLNYNSLFRELTKRKMGYRDIRFIARAIIQVALQGGELSDLESGMPFYLLIDTLTDEVDEQ